MTTSAPPPAGGHEQIDLRSTSSPAVPPCQPVSHSGLHRGIGDPRWGWPWMLDVIDAVRPPWVILENVRGLLRNTEEFGVILRRILRDLADRGFDAEWSLVSACSVGAPHVRRRLFLVAHAQSCGCEGRCLDVTVQPTGWEEPAGGHRWEPERGFQRVADGLPGRVEQVHAYGNAVVPVVAELVGRRVMAAANSRVQGPCVRH